MIVIEARYLVRNPVVCHMYIAVDSVEVKIEADRNAISECLHDDMPSTGMFAVSSDLFSALYIFFFYYIWVWGHVT